jgi:starvation-inducible DNA-binding protein
MASSAPAVTVPGMDDDQASRTIAQLEDRLAATLDLQLTLKHVHWNVVGVSFIAVHEMLDPQVDAAREMSDTLAERIATLGGEPKGTPGAIVAARRWDDYALNREPTVRHLAALDDVYTGVVGDHRRAIAELGEIDPVSEDILIGQTAQLELFQWFIRAHLKDADGDVVFRRSEGGDGKS